jgi:hypothetical protein
LAWLAVWADHVNGGGFGLAGIGGVRGGRFKKKAQRAKLSEQLFVLSEQITLNRRRHGYFSLSGYRWVCVGVRRAAAE